MGSFNYALAVRILLSRNQGAIYHDDICTWISAFAPLDHDAINAAIRKGVDDGEISPSTTDAGHTTYTWSGGFVEG